MDDLRERLLSLDAGLAYAENDANAETDMSDDVWAKVNVSSLRRDVDAILALLSPADGWRHTCATCKHWKFDEPDWEFNDLRMGECKAIKQRESLWAGIDGAVRWTDEGEKLGRQAMIEAKAIAVDGSGYYAAVRTLGDFGCVKHEPLPAAPPPPGGGDE